MPFSLRSMAVAGCLLAAAHAQAQLSVGGSASIGKLDYAIESNTGQRWAGDARMTTLSLDLALPSGGYGSISVGRSNGGELNFRFRGGPASRSEFDRQDTALTLGYAFDNQVNTFLGLRSSKTELRNAIGTKFSTVGYFVGLSYPIALGPVTLALTGALGLNSGTWQDSSGRAKENAFGASGGAKLAWSVAKGVVISAGYKAQVFSYDFESTLGRTLDEDVRSVDFGVQVSF